MANSYDPVLDFDWFAPSPKHHVPVDDHEREFYSKGQIHHLPNGMQVAIPLGEEHHWQEMLKRLGAMKR